MHRNKSVFFQKIIHRKKTIHRVKEKEEERSGEDLNIILKEINQLIKDIRIQLTNASMAKKKKKRF